MRITDSALKELQILMPPLEPVEEGEVDWKRLETSLNLQFPKSYKEFISVYGSSIWFDSYSLFYTTAKSQNEIDEYQQTLKEKLDDIRFDMVDGNTRIVLEYGIGPSSPGLLPFMIDYDGDTYLWLMSGEDPEEWPILIWEMGPTYQIGALSLAEMFLRWLKREEPMLSVWGDSAESKFAEQPLKRR